MHCTLSRSSQCNLQELSGIAALGLGAGGVCIAKRAVVHSVTYKSYQPSQCWYMCMHCVLSVILYMAWDLDVTNISSCELCRCDCSIRIYQLHQHVWVYNSQYIKDIYLHNQINTHLVLVLQWQWDIL